MRVDEFQFDLPDRLIARYPAARRSDSRLLHLPRRQGEPRDRRVVDLPELLHPGDLLVFNDTRVIPARLLGKKDTGGAVEVLVERVLDDHQALAHVRASKAPRPGRWLILEQQLHVEVLGREQDLFLLRFDAKQSVLELLEAHGRIPLPPYMERAPSKADRQRYQTVYARKPGAVAAPTAGLHFDQRLFNALRERGVETAFVTLHVGAGTFQPVRVETVEAHRMHAERIRVDEAVCQRIAEVKAAGGRVVAVGTTVVRSLESAARDGELKPFEGETDIFIYPGYEFRVIDAMMTNFHLPGSTLLMLVSAFAGRERVLAAYRHAVEQQYRFYSYGDAMLID